ncbi:DUF2550 domain-containing protein [Corynebacterium tapiri]|uniref:DUF2550 family protein n=1 Tax=Corynebacterium tapiri TaxID=1448266 RepID=A0A5C4U6L1_9CORY|nr:DUF2550 domain-containing protein [Corynebacterium tapiri]TNL99742.1 DUF2550 family protein [Corynebacterium tapiri]
MAEKAIFIPLAVLLVVLALAGWRFFTVRTHGTPALVRSLPAGDSYSWRHGVIQYFGDELHFFKLRSLSPRPDITFHRSHVSVIGHRRAYEDEATIIADSGVIVELATPKGECELALDSHSAKAIIAWVESAPNVRQEARDHKALLMKIAKGRKR